MYKSARRLVPSMARRTPDGRLGWESRITTSCCYLYQRHRRQCQLRLVRTTTTTRAKRRWTKISAGSSAEQQPPHQHGKPRCFGSGSGSGSSSSSSSSNNQPPMEQQQQQKHNGNQSRRRRRRISLSARCRKLPLTARDRLRALRETNLVATKSLLDRSHLQDAVELARSRAEYVKNQLFRYWNPDYDGASSAASKITSTSTTSRRQPSAAKAAQIRQFRYTTVMDERWWFWNVLFALLPAFLIAAHCELRGIPAQREHARQQELAELQLVLGNGGDNGYDETRALQLIEARREDARERTAQEELEGFFRLARVWWSGGRVPEEENEKDNDERDNNNKKSAAADESPSIFPTVTPKIVPKPAVPASAVPATTTTTNSVPAPEKKESTPSSSSSNSPTPGTPSMEELLERIRQLEERAALQSSATTTTTTTPTANQKVQGEPATDRRFLESVERGAISGTRSRVEDDIFRKWKPYLDKVPPPSKEQRQEQTTAKDDDRGATTATLTTKFLDMVTPLLWGGEKSADDDDDDGESRPDQQKPPTAVGSALNKRASESPSTSQSTQLSSQAMEPPKSTDAAATSTIDRKHDSQETPALQSSATETSNSETAKGSKPWWGRFWPRSSG